VIGKSRRYSPSEGVSYVSIRPENIVVVDKSVRDYWLLDTCKSLKTRLDASIEAQQMEPPEVDKLVKLGYDATVARGVIEALQHYELKQPDIVQYRNMLVEVLRYLVVDEGDGYVSTENTVEDNLQAADLEFKTGDDYTVDPDDDNTDDELEFEAASEVENDSEDKEEHEQKLLDVISSFKGKKYANGVPWHDLVVKATKEGIDKNSIEDIVNALLDTGKVYEPMLGRVKCMG